MISKKNRDLIALCFMIALIIFLTSVLSEFSVRMYYGSTDSYVQIVLSFVAIVLIWFVLCLTVFVIPSVRKALQRMFGMDEETSGNESK